MNVASQKFLKISFRGIAMKYERREFLHFAAGAIATATATPSALRAQGQAVKRRTARDRLEDALSRIADPKGEGARACLTTYAQIARDAADAADARERSGVTLGPLDGAIVSIKDLFDVAGEPTRAGSKIQADAPPAKADAPVVRRLRSAGAVIVAKTNMVEFAFSGIGTNPHYGTPGNPADRARVPGGSTSGGAVAVADGMCEIAIGSDTGGSTRIPAALCGLVGYKPTKLRVPTDGAFPLSSTLDSIGPIAKSVAACAAADAVLAADDPSALEPVPLSGIRFGIPQGLPLQNLDDTVASRFSDALKELDRNRVRLSEETIPLLDDMVRSNSKATFAAAEGYSIHRERLATRAGDFDPFVRSRIEAGSAVSAADYMAIVQGRMALARAMNARLLDLDGLVLPTTPIVAPTIVDVSTAEGFAAKNGLVLRNPALVNFFDLCAISLPLPRAGGLPVGLMLVARNGQDRRLFRMAAAVERLFAT
jgi:aspartyl-tRNA(Asn)/glutamyl-tRNA(Gln) amidotransferase subunit A